MSSQFLKLDTGKSN